MSEDFTFQSKPIKGGRHFLALNSGQSITYAQTMNLLRAGNEKFTEAFLQILTSGTDAPAYFFETPGTTLELADRDDFEFVLKDAHALNRVSPDRYAFAEYFG